MKMYIATPILRYWDLRRYQCGQCSGVFKGVDVERWGWAVVEWWRSRPLECEFKFGVQTAAMQGVNLKRDFCFIRTSAVVKACHPCRVRP